MGKSVKCTGCNNWYNGEMYDKCPYCGTTRIPTERIPTGTPVEGGIPKNPIGGIKKTEKLPRGNGVGGEDVDEPKPYGVPMELNQPNPGSNTISILPNTPTLGGQPSSSSENKNATQGDSNTSSNQGGSSLTIEIQKIGKTVGRYVNSKGESVKPVVGWIIGVKGADYGKAFALYNDWNKVGRSSDCDVSLADESVSRDPVLNVVYDARSKVFSALPADGGRLCYINGNALYERTILNGFEELEFGDSGLHKYVFVPLCGEKFDWKQYQKTED